jgi:hypothetical protein
MARVRGPLFSLNASGTIGRRLTFRVTPHGIIAQVPPIPGTAATPDQLTERQSMRDAAAAWANLSANDRAIWDTPDFITTRHGFMSFFLEWKTQRIQPGGVPLIPARYLGTPTRHPWPEVPPPVFLGSVNLHNYRLYVADPPPAGPVLIVLPVHIADRKLRAPAPPPASRGEQHAHGTRASHFAYIDTTHHTPTYRAHGWSAYRHTTMPGFINLPRKVAHIDARHLTIASRPPHERGTLKTHGMAAPRHRPVSGVPDHRSYIGHQDTHRFIISSRPAHARGTINAHRIHGPPRRA